MGRVDLGGVEVRGLGLGKLGTVRRLDVLLWWNVVGCGGGRAEGGLH